MRILVLIIYALLALSFFAIAFAALIFYVKERNPNWLKITKGRIITILVWIGLNVLWYRLGETTTPFTFLLVNGIYGTFIFGVIWPRLGKHIDKS